MAGWRRLRQDTSWLTPYLRAMEITGVPDSQRPWSIRWVERFAEFLGEKTLCVAVREDVETFTAFLRSRPGAEEWKVLRAADALRLLITAVYGKSWEPPRGAPPGSTLDPGLDPLRAACRARGYSRRTEEAYAHWVRRFVAYREAQRPAGSDTDAVRGFLERLVTIEMVSASTQSQALNALVFWFRQALGSDLCDLGDFQKAKRPRSIPVVLSRDEVSRLLGAMEGDLELMARLLYGPGCACTNWSR